MKISDELGDEQDEGLPGAGGKLIIFSQWTSMLTIIEQELDARAAVAVTSGSSLLNLSWKYCRLDGSLSQAARTKVLTTFQKENDVGIILISLKAGGVGINLISASNVIMADLWFNPATEDQVGEE